MTHMHYFLNNRYRAQAELLCTQVLPALATVPSFALHGGSAINLFVLDLPRYSVDADVTFIPLMSREETYKEVNKGLKTIADHLHQKNTSLTITHSEKNLKLYVQSGVTEVKLEVNNIKRGVVCGDPIHLSTCPKIRSEFGANYHLKIVPMSLLYGGKVAAALERQHPRDLFDISLMPVSLEEVKDGIIYCLLSSGRPLNELIRPHLLDQKGAMENTFVGMTEIPFSYEDYCLTRDRLFHELPRILTEEDKELMISFELGQPCWDDWSHPEFASHPSIQWKQRNIQKLKADNPQKMMHHAYLLQELLNPLHKQVIKNTSKEDLTVPRKKGFHI